jgi:hypothetical protein
MQTVREDLIASLSGVDAGRMLQHWRWLIPSSFRPLFATALGDLFLRAPDDRVMWLEMGCGDFHEVAGNQEEFWRAAANPGNAQLWFGAALVDQLRAGGHVLGRRQCYSYIQLPLWGGKYEPTNFRIQDISTHFGIWGPIHERLRDLPDGAVVELKVDEQS